MSNILFLCHRIPYPPNKGEKIRSFNILKYLTKKNVVSVGCLIDDPKDLQLISTLARQTQITFFDHFSPKYKKFVSTIKAFVTGQTISVPYFYSKKLQTELDTFLDDNSVDTVICSSSPSAEYVFRSRHYKTSLQKANLIMDFIDMDSQKWQQYAERINFPYSLIYQRESNYLLKYEKRITNEFDQLIIVSEAEKKLFQDYIPTNKIHAISNGVDLDFFCPEYTSTTKLNSPSLVFTGAMDYWPNIDGALWFTQKVLPRIQHAFPEACLYLVGSNPSSQLNALQKNKGVIVTGFVEDVRNYIAQADVCVIPLRIARGIQNKVLEAMSMGRPIVSTPEAVEGLNINPPKDLSIQKDEISFANAIISLLKNKMDASLLGKNARKSMEKNYSWDKNLRLLDAIIPRSPDKRK